MAVVSKVSTLKFSAAVGGDTAGFRQWQASAAVQDTAAGSSVVITTAQTSGGAAPPGAADTLTLNVYASDGTTLIKAFTLNAASASQTSTFFFTANGNSGGGNRAGTFILDLRATKTTGGPTATYDYETDGAPATPPTAFSAVTVDRGYVRGTTSATQALSNASLGGGDTAPYQYQDGLYLRTTLADQLTVARAGAQVIRGAGGGTTYRSGAPSAVQTFDSSFISTSTTAGRVNGTGGVNEFPAASTNVETSFSIANNPTTGIAETTFALTADTATVDPRLTVAHHLQIDNSTFATPPYSDPNSADGSAQRVFPSNGYITTNLRGARGSRVGNVVSGGINSIDLHIAFVAAATGQDYPGDFTTATKGGEAGWHDFYIWTAVVGGHWDKTVTLRATVTDLTSAYLINPTIQYSLIATNPNLAVICGSSNYNRGGRHFQPGVDPFFVGLTLRDVSAGTRVIPDTGSAIVRVFRFNYTALKLQYLDPADYKWKDADNDNAVPSFALGATSDAAVFAIVIPSDGSAAAGADVWIAGPDYFVMGKCLKDGSPYSNADIHLSFGSRNEHDRYAFDGPGFVGFPTR